MILRTLAVLLCAASANAAELSLEALSASSQLTMPAAVRFATTPHPDGTVSGSVGGQAVELTFSRRSGKISGALEQRAVTLNYTGDGNSAEGSAFGQGADYAAKTNEDGSFTFAGHVRGQAFSYAYSDAEHYVKGAIGGRKVDITFDPEGNSARGSAGGQEFSLSLEPVSGKLTGTIEGQAIELTLINEGLGNFLENLFLFVR